MKLNSALCGMYLALSLICSYIESFITLPFVTPGIKLGLTNIIIVFIIYTQGIRVATLVSVIRVLLVSSLFGNGFTIIYSIAGACVALVAMLLAKKVDCFSVVGVSIIGALGHNVGQLVVAMVLLNTTSVVYYFIVLLLSALITGTIIGVLVKQIIGRVKYIVERGGR